MEDLFDTEVTVETEEQEEQQSQAPEVKDDKTPRFRDEYFKTKAELEKKNAELEKTKNALKEFGVDGDVDEALIKKKAEKTGQTVEEIKAERQRIAEEAERKGAEKAKKEYEAKLAWDAERVRELAEIKAKYPDIEEKDTLEFGTKFGKLMATGEISALDAYELAVLPTKTKKATVSTGSTSGGQGKVEKDYYTADEVKAMSQSEVSKNFEKIEKSMKKWK